MEAAARRWGAIRDRPLAPVLILAGAMVLATVLVFAWAGDRTFTLDEWEYVVNRGPWTLDNLLRPANGHLLAVPLIAYKALLSTFGATSHLPFTLLSIALQLTVAGLLYAIAARRLGAWIALLPSILILFYGAGWEVLINTAAMQNQFGIAAGLGMILALDRGDRRGDLAAGLLLALSLASFTIGVAFAVGAAIRILAVRPAKHDRRRLWLVAAPLLAYAVWFVWARKFDQTALSAASIGSLVSGVFDQLNAIAAGITGLFRQGGLPDLGDSLLIDTSRTAALVFLLVALASLRFLRPPRPSPAALAAVGILVTYLVLVAIGLGGDRVASSSRYVYMGSVLVLLAAVELADGLHLRRGWVLGVAAAVLIALVANVAEIRSAGRFFEQESAYNRAELAIVEQQRSTINPEFVPEAGTGYDIFPHQDLLFTAKTYFDAVDRFGSPAYSIPELLTAPEPAREGADELLVKLDGSFLSPAGRSTAGSATPPPPDPSVLNAEVSHRGSCVVLTPLGPSKFFATFDLPPEGLTYRSSTRPKSILLGRFGDVTSVRLAGAGSAATIMPPPDGLDQPWHVGFVLTAPTSVCTA